MQELSISIVIPAHREKNLQATLADVVSAYDFYPVPLTLYVVLNESEADSADVRAFHMEQASHLRALNLPFSMEVLHLSGVSRKKAGVGYARKSGMNLAVQQNGNQRSHILVCLDGDCRLRKDYLQAWREIFSIEKVDASVMQFEHSTTHEDSKLNHGILAYEAHLRYYHHLQHLCGYPHAMQAIGSCLSVRADFYVKMGGMNTRKAGEDFYFLQKCQLNGIVAHACNSRVYPSNRLSDRVPFGTGRAMQEFLEAHTQLTYHYSTLPILKKVIATLSVSSYEADEMWTHLPATTQTFFEEQGLYAHWEESARHTKSDEAFQTRIFRWFHPFRLMKLMHFLRDEAHPNIPVEEALQWYYSYRNKTWPGALSAGLDQLREWGESDGIWKAWGKDRSTF